VGEPVASWTPPERWLFEAIARDALVVERDGAGPERLMAWTQGEVLLLPLPSEPVTVLLAPRAGQPWRERWALAVAREGGSALLDAPGARARLEGRGDATVTMLVRAVHASAPPVDGAAPVPLVDAAFGKHTRQSSGLDAPEPGLAGPTQAEAAPWWEIDLGAAMFLDAVRVWLPELPRGTQLSVVAYAYGTPTGAPPSAAWRHTGPAAEKVAIAPGTVARHLRVELAAPPGETVALALRGVEILAAELFADTLLATWQRAFSLYRDRPLFSSGTFQRWSTYGEVWAEARRLAAGLAARLEAPSLEAGERVFLGLCLVNRAEWVVADLAAVMRGYVVVPLAPDDPIERLVELVNRCGMACLLCEPELEVELAARCPSLRLVVACGSERYRELVAGPPDDRRDLPDDARVDEDALYTLLFTSGSTGAPKGAMRSYRAFHHMLRIYGAVQPAVHLSFQPLSHLSERMQLPTVILHGGQIGFSRGGAEVLADLAALEPTFVFSVPRLYEVLYGRFRRALRQALAARPDASPEALEAELLAEHRLAFGRRLQSLSVGSAPCSPEVMAFLRRCFADVWVSEGYGSTEIGTIAVDGRVHEAVEVKLVAVPELGHSPDGDPPRGEICVRSPHRISGYFGEPAATSASFDAEGFFHTGDLGERGPDGSVHVVGRLKSAVKLAHGEFVSPDRVEAVLAGCPLVDQIYVHADARLGVVAAVVPSEIGAGRAAIERALAVHGRSAGLAGYELPRAVLVLSEPMTVANGLRTASGKLRRAAARDRFGAALAALVEGEAPAPADAGLLGRLTAIASDVLGRAVDADAPLADGIAADSLGAAEVLRAFSAELGHTVPLPYWFAAPTLRALAERLASGAAAEGAPSAAADRLLPLPAFAAPAAPWPPRVILLTGATGLLGAHLVEALRARDVELVCLVRGASRAEAEARFAAVLDRHGVAAGGCQVLAGDLALPRLGLEPAAWERLAADVDAIAHAGAVVSWLARYQELRAANVLGTLALLELAATAKAKPFHFVSTISTAPADGDEGARLGFEAASAGSPYALSKWLAEDLVRRAGAAGLPVAIYRPAMIAGHSRRGCGNPDDYVNRYLRGCAEIGLHLDLADERLDMTPVDFVAAAIAALATREPASGATHQLCNIERSLSYRELGAALRAAGVACRPSGYAEFRQAAAASAALRPLAAYFPEGGFALRMGPWPDGRTRARLASLGVVCPPVDERLVSGYVGWLRRRGLLVPRFRSS
jgi:fatty acid CoA ligase FadD9